jgi:hypothetical protein
MPTLADGSPLPGYITYDMETNFLTVTASSSLTPVNLTLKLYAYLRVTTPREFNTLTVELYGASSITPIQPKFNFEFNPHASISSVSLPGKYYLKPTPPSAYTNIVYAIAAGSTAPAGLTISSDVLQVSPSTPFGIYDFSVTATDTVSTKTAILSFSIYFRGQVVSADSYDDEGASFPYLVDG